MLLLVLSQKLTQNKINAIGIGGAELLGKDPVLEQMYFKIIDKLRKVPLTAICNRLIADSSPAAATKIAPES